ncbi:NAD-binding protein [Nonomuraea sp. NBC_01738]|uniref:CASTOR/POLLUX-related putative ion channel n=1 Tax=Nonomuraea sp. NBC_01738 TaxID=2976003 RepID=UPI002E15D382|nr:NAD-binding protein [Nonomuraea sp. NBC_01738]
MSTRQRLRYWFDNTMARGTPALVGWLAVVSLVVVVVLSALIVWITPERELRTTAGNTLREIWHNTAETFDLGSGTETRPLLAVLTVLLAAVGIFFASTLIGLLTSGVSGKIMDLRKGRSLVLETGHTVILGWSDEVFTVISELVEANRSRGRSAIAILAAKDRTEMEDLIRDELGHTGRTRIICRTGSPEDVTDIGLVNPQAARSIIVLSPPGPRSDQRVIKALLAVTNAPDRRAEPYHIVASVGDGKNHAAALLAGGGEAQVVNGDEITARVIVQTCRQSGLSVVLTDLLDFAGDEIYVAPARPVAWLTFGEAALRFPHSSLIGVERSDGTVRLKPPASFRIGPTDKVVVIAEDDDRIEMADAAVPYDEGAIAPLTVTPAGPESALVLGWNRRAPAMLREFNSYVAPGSSVDVVAGQAVTGFREETRNVRVSFVRGDCTDRDVLDELKPSRYDHIIVLSPDDVPGEEGDARTLVTLLHLRDMQARRGERYRIVSEMNDDKNRRLAQVTRADDFIVGNTLISLLKTQLSENRHLADVFDDLFDPHGAEIYLKPAADYVTPGREITFATAVVAGTRREEAVIGYRVAARSAEAPSYGVVLNPPKSAPVTFATGDKLIMLADDD